MIGIENFAVEDDRFYDPIGWKLEILWQKFCEIESTRRWNFYGRICDYAWKNDSKKKKNRIRLIHFKISNISTIIQQQQSLEGSIYFHTLNFSQCIIFIVKAI